METTCQNCGTSEIIAHNVAIDDKSIAYSNVCSTCGAEIVYDDQFRAKWQEANSFQRYIMIAYEHTKRAGQVLDRVQEILFPRLYCVRGRNLDEYFETLVKEFTRQYFTNKGVALYPYGVPDIRRSNIFRNGVFDLEAWDLKQYNEENILNKCSNQFRADFCLIRAAKSSITIKPRYTSEYRIASQKPHSDYYITESALVFGLSKDYTSGVNMKGRNIKLFKNGLIQFDVTPEEKVRIEERLKN